MYHVSSIIVFNKIDLHRKKEQQQFEKWKEMYEEIGYLVKGISVKENTDIEEVKRSLKDKITLISGHSGVGKSSLLNVILPDLNLKIQDVSGWSGKGVHTTTFAEMFDLPFGGKIIDTPGMREFGLVDLSRQELSHYFPDMRERLIDCQFNNCLHVNEPNCAIKAAVTHGQINEARYSSYLSILNSIGEKSY
jgi:ribosome biogenesis GTPase